MYYKKETVLFLDGQWKKAEDANVTLYNQTMHYGLGVFEGIRSYQTDKGPRVFKAEAHYERLLWSAEKTLIPFDYSVEQLIAISYELLEKNGFTNAYLRPLVYLEPCMSLVPAQNSHFVMMAWEWGRFLGNKLVRVITSPYCRPDPRSCIVEAKVSGHYVNSILAGTDARKKGYDEALLLDTNGYVAEGPGANFFYENNGILYTCPRGTILPGITRATILELAVELDIPVKETLFTPDEVKGADGAFFVGTAAEVAGISSLDDVPFKKEWPETFGFRLSEAYQQLVTGKQPATKESVSHGA